MNERIEDCLYNAGLTAQGCWDQLDDYAKQGIERLAELIVKECSHLVETHDAKNEPAPHIYLLKRFGIFK